MFASILILCGRRQVTCESCLSLHILTKKKRSSSLKHGGEKGLASLKLVKFSLSRSREVCKTGQISSKFVYRVISKKKKNRHS